MAPSLTSKNPESNSSKFHHSTLKRENKQQNIKKDCIELEKVKDLSKFIPGEIPPFNKDSKTKFRNTIVHSESEVPHFLRERTSSRQRQTIDGDQVRKTVKSFNDLLNANEKTSQQLYKEVKEAAEL